MKRPLHRSGEGPSEPPRRGDQDHVRFMVKPEIAEPLPGSFSPRAHGFTFTHFDTRAPLIFSERIFARLSFTDIQTDKPLKTPSKNSFRFLLQLFRRWSILDPLKGQDTMNEMTEIKPAIARSISHNEIVILRVESPESALEAIDTDENVTECDWVNTHDQDDKPMIDVWGKRLGENFRIYILRD